MRKLPTNSRISKLNFASIKHIICSHPYAPLKTDEQDLLLAAIRQSLAGIHKLREGCSRLNHQMDDPIHALQQNTEALLTLLEPVRPAQRQNDESIAQAAFLPVEARVLKNAAAKLWASPQKSERNRTRKQ